MKSFTSLFLHYLGHRASRRNLRVLGQLLLVLVIMVAVYSVAFHYLMAWEGREYSWITGVYWTLTVMSTLGFGDITFHTDLGLLFSILVLLSGLVFMLILLPFTFIQFFYAPWMEAQEAARAPRKLPAQTEGHVVLTHYDPIGATLIKKLSQYQYPYAILVPEVTDALRLHDLGLRVVVGDLDDPETYQKLRIDKAALVATTHSDVINTNVAFTAREVSEQVPIVATAADSASAFFRSFAARENSRCLRSRLRMRLLSASAACLSARRLSPLAIRTRSTTSRGSTRFPASRSAITCSLISSGVDLADKM